MMMIIIIIIYIIYYTLICLCLPVIEYPVSQKWQIITEDLWCFLMCKKNLSYNVVKYIFENRLMLIMFLVMGFECLRNLYGKCVGLWQQDWKHWSELLQYTYLRHCSLYNVESPGILSILFVCGWWITILDWYNNLLLHWIFVVGLFLWLHTELC